MQHLLRCVRCGGQTTQADTPLLHGHFNVGATSWTVCTSVAFNWLSAAGGVEGTTWAGAFEMTCSSTVVAGADATLAEVCGRFVLRKRPSTEAETAELFLCVCPWLPAVVSWQSSETYKRVLSCTTAMFVLVSTAVCIAVHTPFNSSFSLSLGG